MKEIRVTFQIGNDRENRSNCRCGSKPIRRTTPLCRKRGLNCIVGNIRDIERIGRSSQAGEMDQLFKQGKRLARRRIHAGSSYKAPSSWSQQAALPVKFLICRAERVRSESVKNHQ